VAVLWDAALPPEAITTFARNVPLDQSYILNRILPDRYINDIEVSVDEVTITRQAAKYRAWDAPPAPLTRGSYVTKKVALPPLGGFLGKGERERLELERLNTGGQRAERIAEAIYNDTQIGVDAVNARVEIARGDLLTDGVVNIDENGTVVEADFGVPGSNIGATLTSWATVGSATPLSDMRAWSKAYRDLNGFSPGGFICSEDVFFYLMENEAIRDLYGPAGTNQPDLVTEDQLTSTLRARRLPPLLFTYDAQVNVDGATVDVLPSDKVIFVPPAGVELGYTAWGITATALELSRAGAQGHETFRSGPGIVGIVDKDVRPPYREEVVVDACALPVLTNPKALMVMDVIL
jgi:hypothetical protein